MVKVFIAWMNWLKERKNIGNCNLYISKFRLQTFPPGDDAEPEITTDELVSAL